jgi:mRNA-degrading endonuclease RelE of RelBE toxin-antitoxin system
MKVPTLPDNIKVHPNVWRAIKEIAILDDEKAARIIQRIAGLGLEPVPVSGDCKSETIKNLSKKKIFVKRLKCLDILDYRIFYAFKKSGMVCVYCIVPRNEDTYNEDSWHYQMVKLLYTQWKECQ